MPRMASDGSLNVNSRATATAAPSQSYHATDAAPQSYQETDAEPRSESHETSLPLSQSRPETELPLVPQSLSQQQSQSISHRLSHSAWQSSPQMATLTATATHIADPHAALLQGHDHTGPLGRTRNLARSEKDDAFVKNKSSRHISKQSEKMITPYLAQHIPHQYKPQPQKEGMGMPEMPTNTKYCYRHRPDLLCRKQADEPTMETLQKVCGQGISKRERVDR